MDFVEAEPSAALEGVVRSLWLVRGEAPHRLERIFPMPFVHLIVNLSAPYRTTDPLSGARSEPLTGVFCSGLQSHFTLSENPGTLFNLGAVIEPDAVGRLGLAPSAITGRVVDAGSALPVVAAFRTSALAAVGPGADSLLNALDAALVLSLTDDEPDLLVRRAVAAITAQPSLAVASLAAECGLSHKGLIDRFRRATGVTPKFYATVVRFHRLIDELPLGDDVPWAELAAATGYYDQSHVIRAFKTFTGFTPQDYYRIARLHGRESARFVPVG